MDIFKRNQLFKPWFWVSIIHVSFIAIGGAELVAFQKHLAWGSDFSWTPFQHEKWFPPTAYHFYNTPFFPPQLFQTKWGAYKKKRVESPKWSSQPWWAGAHLRLHFWLTCTYRFLTHLYLQNLKNWLSYTYKGGVGWGGVGMITYRSGARQTWAYIRPKGGVGVG